MTQSAENKAEDRHNLLADLEDWSRTPMLVLSAAWLVLLVLEFVGRGSRLLETLGLAIWAVFLLEFVVRLTIAPDKLRFIARNWLTVLALAAPAFRLVRVFRLMRLARAARGVRFVRLVASMNRGMNALKRTMSRRGLAYVLAATVLVLTLGAAGMQAFEAAGPNAAAFDSFGESLWWTAMILTTMGSQAWPETLEGRLLALLLSVYAFTVFGYITAALASFFVDRDRDEREERGQLALLRDEIAQLRRELSERGGASAGERGGKAPLANPSGHPI